MDSFLKKWGVFVSIILDPWTLCFIILTIFLGYHITLQKDPTILTLFSILLSLSSAVVGARILKEWVDITEGGIVVARGKSAVRGLKLLLNSIIALDKRIDQFSQQEHNKETITPIIINIIDELRGRCNLMAEEAVNSIENWTDIIPEADVKSQIGIISELKSNLESSNLDLGSLKKELSDTKGKSSEDIKKLERKVKDKELEIIQLQKQVRDSQISFGTSGYGLLNTTSGTLFMDGISGTSGTSSVLDNLTSTLRESAQYGVVPPENRSDLFPLSTSIKKEEE